MEEKLPLYKMLISDDIDGEEEVDFVALVESPAIQRNFLAFSQQFVEPSPNESKDDFLPRCIEYVINEGKESEQAVAICSSLWHQKFKAEKKIVFAVQDEEQKIVSGPLMIADLPIYRRDEEGEYYVMFTKDQIKKIVQRFFKKGYQAKVNIEHGKPADGVYMFESYIIDRERGVNPPKGFEDVANGSWFGSFKVENEGLWQKVKDGTFKGFSVEGLFKYEKTGEVMTKEEEIMSQIFKILGQIEQ
jgi:hypothetical protein